jgi:hypothetical protein
LEYYTALIASLEPTEKNGTMQERIKLPSA